MRFLNEIGRRVARALRRDAYTRELAEEMETHIAMRAEAYLAAGLPRRDALDLARRRFGNPGVLAELGRDVWGGRWLEEWLGDCRLALRSLRREPAFTTAAVLTLALGIGATTSVLSVWYSVLIAPLPMRDPARVVALWGDNPTKQPEHIPLSGSEYTAFAREARSFSRIAAVDYQGTLPRLVQFGDTVASIPAALVTGGFFDVLGARPIVGRLLRPDDDSYGEPFVGVISERLWRNAYGADPAVIGTRTKFYLRDMTIVGVVAGDVGYPGGAQLWGSWPNYAQARDTLPGFFDVVGRLAPGATVAQARGELGAFLSRPDEPHSGARRLLGDIVHPVAMPITDTVVGTVRPALRIIVGAVALLLLVTCVNVANLMLLRTLARRRDLTVRAALGAGQRRIAQLVLAEAAVVSAMGGALGVACAVYAVRAFAHYAPAELPRGHAVSLEVPVLVAAIAICVAVTFLAGAIPAATGGRVHAGDTLRERRAGQGHTLARQTRAVLVATQVAVAVAVLVAAGVVLQSFETLAHDHLGFRPDHLIIARFGQNHSVGNLAAFNDVLGDAIQRVREVPGVRSAAGLIAPPFRSAGNDLAYSLPGDEANAATNRPMADYLGAGPDYFAALGIKIERGRSFTAADGRGAAPVAVVDELLAREAWPGKDPIGQHIGVGTAFYTVVGVAAPTRYRDVLAPRATLYTPYAQSSLTPAYIAVRTTANPSILIPALRRAVSAFDPRIYLADFASMTERVDVSLAAQRLEAQLLGGFAAAILLLTAVALYSVGATFVRYREFEIGVRVALGATPAQVARLVLRQGVVVMTCGVGAGVAIALAAGTVLRAIVYGVSPRDPLAYVVAVAVVCVAGMLAFLIPSRRASRTNAAQLLHDS